MSERYPLPQRALAKLLTEVPDPPCEQLNCPLAARCRAEKLACESYVRYVNSGCVFDPHVKFSGFSRAPVFSASIEATHERYLTVFSE